MNVCGVVAEYNPFHNGHAYQLSKAREMGATHVVSVMSGNFTQRGEAAIIDKFIRADIAVKNGADLVIELPVAYSLSSAEIFARGAVHLLSSLGCTKSISFGCECDDVSLLKKAARLSESISDSDRLRELMKEGISYPAALQSIADESAPDLSEVFRTPNNVLAVEYIKQLDKLDGDFDILPVKRFGTAHDSGDTAGDIASASYIRNAVRMHENPSEFVPAECMKALDKKKISEEKLKELILYKVRTMSRDEIGVLPDVSAELEGRIYAASRTSSSYDELVENIRTKRYTLARISRILCCAAIGIKRDDLAVNPPYIRVLALNRRGAEILKASKNTAVLPIDTSLSRLSKINTECKNTAELECTASDIYALCSDEKVGKDLTAKIEITEKKNEC